MGFENYNKSHHVAKCLENWLPYLTIHQCLDVIQDKTSMILRSSTSHTGPYGLMSDIGWDNEKLNVKLSKINTISKDWSMPFIKLNSTMVSKLDETTIDQIVMYSDNICLPDCDCRQ